MLFFMSIKCLKTWLQALTAIIQHYSFTYAQQRTVTIVDDPEQEKTKADLVQGEKGLLYSKHCNENVIECHDRFCF